ncbi:MAG: enoyl-CoA hydratase/isomerase family protein [Candidatus Rokubacteria bacterium]|nr:enoyl-CoA hydratase/isomerase family protein [Candidatus Rokubacteria bacterium]
MADSPVLVERRGDVALVTLNRPEKHNALSLDLLGRLQTIARELGDDATARVIVVTGNPRCFSTGMDLDDLGDVKVIADTQRVLGRARDANAELERCPKPVIAAIAGWCLTGGFELALACDIRVAADTARFGITSARIGTVAGMGGTQRLPRLVGPGRAKEILFSAEPIDAAEALRIGVVNRVVPAGQEVDAAIAMGRLFAKRAPLSLWFAKTAVNVGLTMPLEAALAYEIGLTTQLFTTEDRAEGLRAFHEKRDAKFQGR